MHQTIARDCPAQTTSPGRGLIMLNFLPRFLYTLRRTYMSDRAREALYIARQSLFMRLSFLLAILAGWPTLVSCWAWIFRRIVHVDALQGYSVSTADKPLGCGDAGINIHSLVVMFHLNRLWSRNALSGSSDSDPYALSDRYFSNPILLPLCISLLLDSLQFHISIYCVGVFTNRIIFLQRHFTSILGSCEHVIISRPG